MTRISRRVRSNSGSIGRHALFERPRPGRLSAIGIWRAFASRRRSHAEPAPPSPDDDTRDTSVLHVQGPLRAPASAELREYVEALLRRGQRRIVLNLANVSDVDAAGLGDLVRAYNAATAADGVLRITHASGTVRDLLARVRLLDLLNGHSERDDTSYGARRRERIRRTG